MDNVICPAGRKQVNVQTTMKEGKLTLTATVFEVKESDCTSGGGVKLYLDRARAEASACTVVPWFDQLFPGQNIPVLITFQGI